MRNNADIRVANHGSIVSLTVITQRARRWIDANVASESWQWFSTFGGLSTLNIEPRYVRDVLFGAQDAGLRISGSF